MALKFWFGKKEPEAAPFGSAGVPSGEGSEAGAAQGSRPDEDVSRFTLSLQTDGTASLAAEPVEMMAESPVLPPSTGPGAGQVKPLGLFTAAATRNPAESASAPEVSERGVSQAAVEGPEKKEAAKPVPQSAPLVLKAVGGQSPALKLTPRAASEVVGGASPVAAPASSATAAARSVFGLRVKADAAEQVSDAPALDLGSAAAPVLVETKPASAAVPTAGANDWVRPKPDQRVLYYQLMDGLYDAILILDEQGHVVDGSKRITDLLGYTRDETWDLPIEKIITGMSRQMFEHLKRNLKESHQILIDARCFRKDGTSFAGEVGVSTLMLTRSSNMVFAIRNVERRKNAMDEMRRSQIAFETAISPGFVCDVDGFFQVVNRALLEAFGIPDAEQAKRVRFVDLLPDAARLFLRAACGDPVREKFSAAAANGVSVELELALVPLKNGQTVTGVAGSMQQPG